MTIAANIQAGRHATFEIDSSKIDSPFAHCRASGSRCLIFILTEDNDDDDGKAKSHLGDIIHKTNSMSSKVALGSMRQKTLPIPTDYSGDHRMGSVSRFGLDDFPKTETSIYDESTDKCKFSSALVAFKMQRVFALEAEGIGGEAR